MTYMDSQHTADPGADNHDELEHLLLTGVSLSQETSAHAPLLVPLPSTQAGDEDENEDEEMGDPTGSDLQSAIALFAEAVQDLVTAGVDLGQGRHFACADSCNQSAEKAAQAVSLLRFGRRTTYDHDLQKLGALVHAPPEIQQDLATLTPFHPETFYRETPPEEADEIINAEQATGYIQTARRVLRWARTLILAA